MGYKTLLLGVVFVGFLFLTLTSQQTAKVSKPKNNNRNRSASKILADSPHFYFKDKIMSLQERLNNVGIVVKDGKKKEEQKIVDAKKKKFEIWSKELKKKKEQKTKNHNNEHHVKTLRNVLLTSYIPLCDTQCTGITATGINVRNTIYHNGLRVVAVDPNIIPLYSIVEIIFKNGRKIKAQALDTGGKINGFHADLLVKTRNKALHNGRKHVKIKILRSGK